MGKKDKAKEMHPEKEKVPHMMGSISFQGLRCDFAFTPEELQTQETIKNKLYLTFKEIFNQFKKNIEAQARIYPFIKNI